MTYRVKWTDEAGKLHRLDFRLRTAAIAKFDRVVSAGATWARVANVPDEPFKEPVVYFEHSECAELIS